MPKKQVRNAFYFFMQHFKEEQRQKGKNLSNGQAADLAGPIWRDMVAPARAKFEEMARKAKERNNVPEMKFTSTGISIAEVQQRETDQRVAEETERKEIRNIVKLAAFNAAIQAKTFFLVDCNSYCNVKGMYVVGEITILQFNLADGILNEYHEVLYPEIPVGYASDAKFACKELGLEYPDNERPNYLKGLAVIIDFLRSQNPDHTAVLPPIFTIPDKIEAVKDFVYQLCNIVGEDEMMFKVYRLDLLFFELINAIKTHKNEGFPKESLALIQIKKDTFKYNPGLACKKHEAGEKAFECTMSRTKRWAYTILDHCCPVVNIELIPGQHVPADYDMDKIKQHKSETAKKIHNTVAALRQPDFSEDFNCIGETSASVDTSFQSSGSSKRNVGEVGMPLLRPNDDYSQAIRKSPGLKGNSWTSGVGRGQSSFT